MATKCIKIINCGSNYLQVIRVIRQITGLGLKDAMDLADNLPIDLFATDQQIAELKKAGATIVESPITTSGYTPSTTRTVTTSSNYSTKAVSNTNSNASSIPQRSFNTQQSPATKRSLPPNTYLGMSGKQYQLSSKLGSGGEGDIFAVSGDSSKVAKIYHADRVSKELEEKLRYMVNKPPRTEVLSQVAWPMDVLYDGSNKFIGFVMPKLTIDANLGEIYAYPPKGAAVMPYNYKLIIAMNICSVIYAVHQAGYIFGDFNPKNIGINLKTGAVAFMDTDSYHIVIDEKANKAYRCKVCLNGYVAPELQKQCEPYGQDAYEKAPLPTFTNETDNFALAIHIFKLLMNGYTPFNGIKETETVSTASPGVGNLAIKRDNYCFKPHNKPQAVAVPPLDALPDDIAMLFNKAFIDGRKDPKERPNALAWRRALENYERVLKKCSKNPHHLYKNTLKVCPWCEADERYKKQFQAKPAPSQRSFPAPISVPTAPQPLVPPSTTQTAATNTVTPTKTTAQSSGVSWKNKFSSPQQRAETISKIGYPVSWILFLAVIVISFIPHIQSGSLKANPSFAVVSNVILNAVPVLLLCFFEHLKPNHKILGTVFSSIWSFLFCFAYATDSYTKNGFTVSSANDTWKTFGVLLVVFASIIVLSSLLGNRIRNGKSTSTKRKQTFKASDIVFIILCIIPIIFFIVQLLNLNSLYSLLSNSNVLLWVLLAYPIIMFVFHKIEIDEHFNDITNAWYFAAMSLNFECLVLSLANTSSVNAVIFWIVLAMVGLALVGYFIHTGDNALAIATTVGFFVFYIFGAFTVIGSYGSGGINAVSPVLKFLSVSPGFIITAIAVFMTLREIVRK